MLRVLGPFCRQYPGIDIHMEVLNRDRLLERLARNEGDLYVMGVSPKDWETKSEQLLENPLVLIAHVGHSLAGRKGIPFEAFRDVSFLVREQGSGTRMTVERTFQQQRVPLNVCMELGSNGAIKQAAAGGLGLAIISRGTLQFGARANDLVELDVEGFPIQHSWCVVRPKGKEQQPGLRTGVTPFPCR